jgi:hypothetical protein
MRWWQLDGRSRRMSSRAGGELTDFRLFDPDGYFLRITSRA